MGLAAKNLCNMGVFLVKNVLSSFGPEEKIRPLGDLHANQIQALAAANRLSKPAAPRGLPRTTQGPWTLALAALEASLASGEIGQAEFDLESPKLKACKLFADFMGPEANAWAVLDDRLLDKLMRARKDAGEPAPSRPCPPRPPKASQGLPRPPKASQGLPRPPKASQGLPRPPKASQQVRMQVSSEFRGWLASLKAYRSHPEKFQGMPKMPG